LEFWQRGGVFLLGELQSLTESDLTALFSTRLLDIARDYVAQERLYDLRYTEDALAGRLEGWSDRYFVRYRMRGGRLEGWCSEGKGRCRHLAALLYAWVTARERFTPVSARLQARTATELTAAVEAALFDPDPAHVLLTEIDRHVTSRDEETLRQAAASLPPLRLLELYLDGGEEEARRLYPHVFARRDEIPLVPAAHLVLALLFRSLATGEVSPAVLRFLSLFPSEELATVLTRHGLAGAAEVVALLRARGEEEAALRVVEVALVLPLPDEERHALLEEALTLSAGLPARRRRYLEELLLLGDTEHLAEWRRSADPDAYDPLAERLAARGQRALAVSLLLDGPHAAKALPLLSPDLPPELLLRAARRLGGQHGEDLAALLEKAALRAPASAAARLRRRARFLRGR
jgi:hypothetical protein